MLVMTLVGHCEEVNDEACLPAGRQSPPKTKRLLHYVRNDVHNDGKVKAPKA